MRLTRFMYFMCFIHVLHVLNMPMDASLACWALFYSLRYQRLLLHWKFMQWRYDGDGAADGNGDGAADDDSDGANGDADGGDYFHPGVLCHYFVH